MSSTTGDAYQESLDVIKVIQKAWEQGHTLVPLLGAGISVDSGMPLVDSIMEYLVMIRKYIKEQAYRPQYEAKPYARVDEQYEQRPIRYIRDYGWPDPFQLRHELMLLYSKIDPTRPGGSVSTPATTTFGERIRQGLDELVSELKQPQKAKYKDLVEKYEDLVKKVRAQNPDARLESTCESTWKMLGDWRAVIRDFTEFTLDDADALFERLYRWHKPGRSHHFWAFLTRLMGLRLFLTTNFDNFLERALAEQGIDHRVFGVEHGDNLPHASLVRETVSIIKLHGDTHRLLLDEKLDYPPSRAYLQRLQDCMPEHPILVVMGCGGSDPRTLKVVQHHGENNVNANGIPSVIWLHFEEPKEDPRTLKRKLGDRIQHARVTNPGLFLSHLYAYLRSQHPASRVRYNTHLALPIAPLKGGSISAWVETHPNNKQNVLKQNVFIYEGRKTGSTRERITASQAMADFVYTKKTQGGYTPIWVNLEAHHSVAGVVQHIVERCRVHDTFVSPFNVRPSELDRVRAAELTAERLFHILRRGRYVVAFDALEAFLWPPTTHHGSSAEQESMSSELEDLFRLLHELMTHSKLKEEIDVVLCGSFEPPRTRRGAETRSRIYELFSDLVYAVTGTRIERTESTPSEPPDAGREPDYDDLFVISCFRCPRSLVSLRSVFKSIFGDSADGADRRIEQLITDDHLFPIEGGFFRMQRSERCEIYRHYSEDTRTNKVVEAAKSCDAEGLIKIIERCYNLASTHGWIARCYYAESYLHSFDPWIFFEYFYHRISSLRYITKLVVLLERAEDLRLMERRLCVRIPPSSIREPASNAGHSLQEIYQYVAGKDELVAGKHEFVPGERDALLQSLKHALIQAQRYLLNGPAAQVEAWCKGVLLDSFLFSVDSNDRALDLKHCRLMRALYGSQEPDRQEYIDDVKEIFWTLLGLLRMSVHEQARYEDAGKLAWVQLEHRAWQGTGPARPAIAGKREATAVLNWLCEEAGKGFAEKDKCIEGLLDTLAGRSDARDQLTEIRRRYERQSNTPLGKRNQLRALCMLAEDPIVDLAGKRFDVCPSTPEAAERLRLIDQALDLSRVVSPEDARDSSHDPYYLQFRARLLLAKARLQWLGTDDSRFRDADYYVESARASVSTDDHAQLARLEMTWAEGLLLQASLCLKNDRADRAAPEQALAAARVHYRRAGDALQRAHEHLSRSSRDVERWAWYHRTWAQCQAEWSLFHLADLENQLRRLGIDKKYGDERRLAGLTPHDMAALLKRLDRGLNGLQAALVIQRDGNRDPGLWRIWLELLCAGMVYGVTTVASTSFYEDLLPETSWPLGVESFWKHWISLNMRAGIPNTVELHGKYCSYLKADVRDAGAETGDWRKGMVDGLCGRTLRDAALAVADELYELTQQGCSPAQFATTLTRRITEIAHPAPCVMPDT